MKTLRDLWLIFKPRWQRNRRKPVPGLRRYLQEFNRRG